MKKVTSHAWEHAKIAGDEVLDLIKAQGIYAISSDVTLTDDGSELMIIIGLHPSEEGKGHCLPRHHKGFKITYEYVTYSTFA